MCRKQDLLDEFMKQLHENSAPSCQNPSFESHACIGIQHIPMHNVNFLTCTLCISNAHAPQLCFCSPKPLVHILMHHCLLHSSSVALHNINNLARRPCIHQYLMHTLTSLHAKPILNKHVFFMLISGPYKSSVEPIAMILIPFQCNHTI
jgi:hypothetical protein